MLSAAPFANAQAQTQPTASPSSAVTPLPALDIAAYMGRWYQMAWFPNFFQKSCVSDTTATYTLRTDGTVEVANRCQRSDGSANSIVGTARPDDAVVQGGKLMPARLEVNFVSWLRWLPITWAPYQVVQLADDGRYAVVSEPSRSYLWVLTRAPVLTPADEATIRARLLQQGFDLAAWQAHRHSTSPAAP